MNLYRIKYWDEHYENNRTRDMKDMRWVPIPCSLDGDGYTMIMEKKNGAALYGAWIACVIVAARCGTRGTLMRSSGIPHDSVSLSRLTRIAQPIMEEMLKVCTLECKWFEIISLQVDAEIPHEGAEIPHDPARNGMEGNRREENRREENGREEKKRARARKVLFSDSEYYDKATFAIALQAYGWEREKIEYYWAAADDYSKSKGATYIDWIAAVRNWDRKNPGEWKRASQPQRRGYGPQQIDPEEQKKSIQESLRLLEEKENAGQSNNFNLFG